MSLRTAVAAPFRTRGSDRMGESEFVVALSLDRDWFSPDQAKRLVDVAASEGLLERDGDELVVEFAADEVQIPEGFVPKEDVLRERSTFERVLDAVVETGIEKQEAVAEINRLQSTLGVTLEAAAVVYARRRGVDVAEFAERARGDL
ncbi:hypothetical protein SAMN05216559_1360 [Halomicrobium zhouii]|uniref:DUF2240 family protein n=1 Tax=Halomicrobium zhouii TaxID=767519 RepID=A0A1I6KR90_9EURY|nr:DUF2240 family protein [Halomicrobium zhouii]SFR93726.1 hypothetical protein SAMN05216559_1360 [Halomicrobium zhouii]